MRRIFLLGPLLLLGACKSEEAVSPVDASSSGLTLTATETARVPFEKLASNLFGQLAAEAQNRPANTPRIEDLVAALRKSGVEVRDPEQGLGATGKARYCAAAMATSGVGFSVCEYGDEHGLAVGREIAEKQFKFPNRSFYTNRTTLLVVRPLQDTEATKKDAALIVEAFKKL